MDSANPRLESVYDVMVLEVCHVAELTDALTGGLVPCAIEFAY